MTSDATPPVVTCPDCGQVGYASRTQAKRAFWSQDHAADETLRTWRCPSGTCHAEPVTIAQITEMLRQRGQEPPEDLQASRPGRPGAEPQYEACGRCGAGWGRPHGERCLIEVPSYEGQGSLTASLITGLTAYALAIFPLDVVRRSTIRAMLPRGETRTTASVTARLAAGQPRSTLPRASVNDTSARFRTAVSDFARRGWIRRQGDCCVISARQPLRRAAEIRLTERADLVTGVREAIAVLARSFPEAATAAGRAQRARELAAIRRLMEDAPGQGPHAGCGYIRIIPRPGRPA